MKNVALYLFRTSIYFVLSTLIISCKLNTNIETTSNEQPIPEAEKSILYSIETTADGSGEKVQSLSLITGSPDINLYAVSRDEDQSFLGAIKVKWSMLGSFGQLNILQGGQQALLTNLIVGSGSIVVEHESNIIIIQVSVLPPPITLAVEALYDNGQDWNDYIKKTNSPIVDNTKPACIGTENNSSIASCVNGGVFRAVRIPSRISCSNLTGEDNEAWFDWYCDDSTGGVIFYTQSLRSNIGLKDLISTSGWKTNFFTLYESSQFVAKSDADTWWGNSVKSLPDNSSGSAINLPAGTDGNNTVYFANGIITSSGYNLNADKLSVVTLEASELKYSSNLNDNCHSINGELDGSEDLICLLSSGGQKFLWIEGNFKSNGSGSNADHAIFFYNVSHSHILNVVVSGSVNDGIRFLNSNNNRLKNLQLHSDPLLIETSYYNKLQNIKIGQGNLNLKYAKWNYIYDLVIANSTSAGLVYYFDAAEANTLVKGLVTNSNTSGNHNLDGVENITTHFTIANSGGYGIQEQDYHQGNLYNNLIVTNSGNEGIYLQAGNSTVLSNIATVNNNRADLYNYSENFTKILNTLLVGTGLGVNYRCQNNIPANPGFDDSTCTQSGTDGSVDYSYAGSNALLRIDKSASNSFVGWVSSDNINSTAGVNSSGEVAYNSITDWVNFDNPFRTWGKKGSTFPSSDNRGRCSAGNCQIWDWRLKATDTMFLNKTFDGSSINSNFIVGGSCPNAVNGDLTQVGYSREILNDGVGDDDRKCEAGETCEMDTFLVNAIEILDDFKGDEDGLCESNEACLYTPNYGVYQGHGSMEGPCNFTDGVGINKVINVEMFQYNQNGI
ncbi:MAG: hypothetical protein KDD58_09120 [Bdellovibrionales bacterium]|nr:hypothetical protein [Bdellovibrionales bacterium]